MDSPRFCSITTIAIVLVVSCCATNSAVGQEIKVGDKVQFQRLGRDYVGEVKSVRVPGKLFSVSYKDGARTESITLPVTRIKVVGSSAPSQPKNTGGNSSPTAPKTGTGNPFAGGSGSSMRTWTDKTGKFKVKAKLNERVDNLVRLETEDGRLITVPVEKLSEFDQKYLESAKANMDENPFAGGEKVDKSGSGNSGESSGGIPLNTVQPDLNAGRKLLLIANDGWNVTPDPESDSAADPQPVEHSDGGFEKPFFDKFGNFVISPDDSIAAVSITNAFGGNRTGIQFLDLKNGKMLSNVGIPVKEASLVGMIVDPPTFATTRKEWFKDKGRVDFWDGSNGLKHIVGWEGNYKFAKLLNDEQLLTIDNKGQAVVWNWKSAKAAYYFQCQPHALPAISSGGKQIAIAINGGIMIVDLDSGKPLGTISTKKRVTLMAFSRKGDKLATIQDGNLAVWDLANASLIDEFALAGITPFNPSMAWADDENILINGSTLVNYRLRVPVWIYKVKHGSMPLSGGRSGRFFYSAKGTDGKGVVIPVKIPQQEVLDVISNYDPEDFLAIKPGMKVSIKMNLPFNQSEQQKIYDSISSKLKANGCEVDPASSVVLNCYTKKGKTQTREYESRGGFGGGFNRGTQKVTFTPTICYMEIAKGSDILWRRSVSSGPGFMMFLGEGESAQQAANKQSKPSPHFYTAAQLPKFYARLPDGKKSLGESELTENGLR